VLKPDPDDNEELYGRKISAADILTTDKVSAPTATAAFMNALQRN
jgi:hypothetical protein